MSREKDFIEAAERLAEAKRTEDAKQQCLYDFGIAADYGYQYAIDKAMVVLRDDIFVSDDIIELFKRVMEE